MHVMCRSTRNTVASVEVPAFMAIHYINAYEDDANGAAVIVDCCEHYGDPAIIHTLLLHRLRSLSNDKDPLPNARYVQYLSTCTPHACLLNILFWAFICGREKKILCDGVACNRAFFVFWSFLKTFFYK